MGTPLARGYDPAEPAAAVTAARILSAVPAWWARRARLAGLSCSWQDWRRALPLPPVELSDADSTLTLASGHALGEAYVGTVPDDERVRHGRHYTPKPLADALWGEIDRTGLPRRAGPVVDPASGTGALLLRPLSRLIRAREGADPLEALAEASESFAGIDNDPLAVWLGNAILGAELLPVWRRVPEHTRAPLPALLATGDGLDAPAGSAGLVVMNPPFGRATLDADTRARWAGSLYGHANWYGVFLHAAVQRASTGAIVAAILPTSFLGGAYYQRLRGYLAEHAPLVRLRLIDDRSGVFSSVLQETCLAIFQKGGPGGSVACSAQRLNGRVRSVNLGRTTLSRDAPSLPWLLPRRPPDRQLIRAAERHQHRLRDYGWSASTGPLVWNRHKPRIDGDADVDSLPIVWAADIETGGIRRSRVRDRQRWIRLRKQDRFMELAEPAVLVQRTTAPEQPRRIVAAALTEDALQRGWSGKVVVENHVNVLRCSRRDGPLSPELLTALLNTETMDRVYRCMTGTVAVSAYELESLPLPDAELLLAWDDLEKDQLAAAVAAAFA